MNRITQPGRPRPEAGPSQGGTSTRLSYLIRPRSGRARSRKWGRGTARLRCRSARGRNYHRPMVSAPGQTRSRRERG
jgi:hypothetical protein